jgi:hypothetical protein
MLTRDDIEAALSDLDVLVDAQQAMRDDTDLRDARMLLKQLSGTREAVWERVRPYLIPGMEDWKRQNFDSLWEDLHGSP